MNELATRAMKATDAPVEVTRADREAAAAYWKQSRIGNRETQRRYLTGEADNSFIVQAFARHRIAHPATERTDDGLVEAVARAICCRGKPCQTGDGQCVMDPIHLDLAQAALAVATPAIVEQCAKVADRLYDKWSNANGFEGHAAAAKIISANIVLNRENDRG